MSDVTAVSGGKSVDDKPVTKNGLVDRIDTRSAIALFLTFAFVLLVFYLAFKDPAGDVFKVLAGALSGVGFASVIGWYFNSTKGSEDKTALLARDLTRSTK